MEVTGRYQFACACALQAAGFRVAVVKGARLREGEGEGEGDGQAGKADRSPVNRDSGQSRGKRMICGGRATVRSAL